MISVKNNLPAVNAANQLTFNKRKSSKITEKLSSGYRINRAADDAAGLKISESMRLQIRGLHRASQNIQEGTSLIQVADGAMHEISDMIHRMKELSIQAANDTNTQEDRASIQMEVNSLLLEIDDIHKKTLFNGIRVLNGKSSLDLSGGSINGGGGTSSGGQYITGNYVKGTLPDWIKNSSQTTSMGYLTESFGIKKWTMYCDSVRDANGNTVTKIVRASDGRFFGAGAAVYTEDRFGYQYPETGMDTLDKTDQSQNTIQFTGADGNTYYADITYRHQTQSYAGAYLDFSKVNASNIQELVGGGFYTTCTECDKRYSIEFVDQGGTGDGFRYAGDKSLDYIYSVDLHGITDPNALIDKIVKVLGDSQWFGKTEHKFHLDGYNQYITSGRPYGHYSSFAAELDANGNRTGRLMLISTAREDGSVIKPSQFPEYGLFNCGVYTYGVNVWVPDPDPDPDLNPPAPADPPADPQEGLYIQTGFRKWDSVFIDLPSINRYTLGLTSVSVLTGNGCDRAMDSADLALSLLNKERTRLGAWQNRLEYAYSNAVYAAENTQQAESRIRDSDMAKEVLENSTQNILLQAGTSLLTQANQQADMILNMLA